MLSLALPTATGFWQAIGIGISALLAASTTVTGVMFAIAAHLDRRHARLARYVGVARVPVPGLTISPPGEFEAQAWAAYDQYRTQGGAR